MSKFKELKISSQLVEHLQKRGITNPTPIQEQSIGIIRDGHDIIAEAQTGTGKTLAFLLPIFDNLTENTKHVQCLIITPTRELAIQITEEANKLNINNKFKILAAYGGTDLKGQLVKLNNNVDIVIATPGRLLDHLKRSSIDLQHLKTLVIDEADQMILMGFKNEVEELVKFTSKKRQTLCFSATMNSDVKKLAYRYTNEPKVVVIEKRELTLANIDQYVVETSDAKKQDALCQVLNQQNPFMAIIFCRTKRRVDDLEESLYERGYNCHKLHSDIPQSKREQIMKSFKNAEIQYLIATDVAARGLDITGVTHVYNYDIPEDTESYIHRIGRTGRAGEKGQTILFVDPKNHEILAQIEKEIKLNLPRKEVPHIHNVRAENQPPKLKYNKRIHTHTKKLEDSDKKTKHK